MSGVVGSEATSGQQRRPATCSRLGLTSISSPSKAECSSRLMRARPLMLAGSSDAPTGATTWGEHSNDRSGRWVSCGISIEARSQVMAEMPRISRPMMSVWISVVPSGIMPPRVSRKMRSIGNSVE